MAAPAVLVMAGAARPGAELGELLGAERAARLEELLLARAMQWASELSPGGVHVAADSETLG